MKSFTLLTSLLTLLAVLSSSTTTTTALASSPSHVHAHAARGSSHRMLRRRLNSITTRANDDTSLTLAANEVATGENAPGCPKRNYWKRKALEEVLAGAGNGSAGNGGVVGIGVNGTMIPIDGSGGSTTTVIGGGATTTTASGDAATTTTKDSDASTTAASSDSPSTSKPASSSTSADEPTETSKPPSSGGGTSSLFPLGHGLSSWSTPSLPLSDTTLRPTKVLRTTTHSYASAPDGKKAIKGTFPEGSYTFGGPVKGGFSFYAKGPVGQDVELSEAREVTFGYRVWFEDGFAFNKGGKLPGLYGGDSDDEATSCSGGRRSDACFSSRLMWRSAGAGELYTYLPPSFPTNLRSNVCDVPPFSECNDTYGSSIGRGSFTFGRGRWVTIAQRVRLNDVGETNGELDLWVEGERVVKVRGVVLRAREKGRVRGVQFQTFFGGSDNSWASPKDQDIYFSDFSLAVLEKL